MAHNTWKYLWLGSKESFISMKKVSNTWLTSTGFICV